MQVYRIPKIGEEPSEEMKEWLSNLEQDWDGDDSGLTIQLPSGAWVIGGPGDWICFDPETGVAYVETSDQIAERMARVREYVQSQVSNLKNNVVSQHAMILVLREIDRPST